jgi:hypothetical protein
MAQLTKDKITEIFCISDDFCKKFDQELKTNLLTSSDGKKHRNRKREMSDSEIITILICFHYGCFKNFKHFYLYYVNVHLKEEFPNLLSYNRFVELERKVMLPLALFLQLVCLGECTGITFIDSTKVAVCKDKRIKRNKVFKDIATVGKSTMGWFFGFKLHLVFNDKGELINFCITPANVDYRNPNVLSKISRDLFGKIYGDKGYISSNLFSMLFDKGIHLVTGIKSNMKNHLIPLYDKIMLRKRSVIETINDELKNICQIEHSRHRSPVNFLMNLLAGLGAYCFFDKKPAIKFDRVIENGQQLLFY